MSELIQQVLDNIQASDSFMKDFITRNPSLEADVVSFKLNPNCTCKHKIVRYLQENPRELQHINEQLNKNKPIELSLGTSAIVDNNKVVVVDEKEMKRLKDERQRMTLKPLLPQSEWSKYKDVIGEVVEIEPNPNKYKQLMSVAREKWFYNGLSVLETVKTDPKTGTENLVWLVFFY